MEIEKGIFQVSPHDVRVTTKPSRRDIEHQKQRLLTEGQIEPVMCSYLTKEPDLDDWAYSDALVLAAQELNWPTILVTFWDRD